MSASASVPGCAKKLERSLSFYYSTIYPFVHFGNRIIMEQEEVSFPCKAPFYSHKSAESAQLLQLLFLTHANSAIYHTQTGTTNVRPKQRAPGNISLDTILLANHQGIRTSTNS